MWRITISLLVACAGDPEKPDDTDEPTDLDVDDDGFEAGDDCDDALASVHPGATDLAYDGVDQDCSGSDLVDVDEDGFDGDEAGGDDCDDTDAEIHPGAEEIAYDDIDQDCSGDDLTDVDGDGYGTDDCNDADPDIHPDAPESYYDGVDQDCRQDCDYDADHDGAIALEWLASVTDGSVCDLDPTPEVGVLEDCDDGDPQANTQQVVSVFPADGATNVDAMVTIEVDLRDSEINTQLRLVDELGNDVPTIWYAQSGTSFVMYGYDPVSGQGPYPLPAFTELTLEVEHSCGTESITFTTGPGLEPVDPVSLVGTTWELLPDGLGYPCWTVLNYFSFSNMGLVAVSGSDGTNLDLRVAAPDQNGQQDMCVPTGEILGLDFSANPKFDAAPFDYPVTYLQGNDTLPFTHQAGSIQATIYQGELLGVTLIGYVETHAVTLEAGVGLNSVCNMWGCVNCPDGSGATCYEETYWLSGNMPQSPVALVPRTAADIAVDPGCP